MITIPAWTAALAAVLILALGGVAAWQWARRPPTEPRLDKTFRDTAGRLWRIAITVATLRRIQAQTGVDLLELVDGTGGKFGALVGRLLDDPILLVDVLYVCVQPEADARGVSDECFGRALGGDVLAVAVDALIAGVIDFFPSRRQRWRLKRAWIGIKRILDRAEDLTEKALTTEATEAILKSALTCGNGSTNSPESAASIPPT